MSKDSDRLDALDYYTLLGVARGASPDAIRDAFRVFAQRYHPDLYVGQDSQKVDRATEIYRRGTEAYRVLFDDVTRRRYDEQLDAGLVRYQPSLLPAKDLARQSIPPELLSQARAAQQAMKFGDYAAAAKLLRAALAQDPNNRVLQKGLEEAETKQKAKPSG